MSSSKIVALLALFSLQLIVVENKAIFNKHQDFTNVKTSGDLTESFVSYAACNDVETSANGKNSRKCKITNGIMAENSELPSCDITFEGKLSDNYTIHAFSADRTLIVWCDDDEKNTDYLLHYTFVHLPDCKTTEATVVFQDYETLSNSLTSYGEAFITNEDGTYDVFFENPKFCGEKVCRMTIDSQGKKIKEPVAAYIPADKPIVLTETKPVNNSIGLAELGIDSGNTRVSLITPDGLKVLKEFETYLWTDNDVSVDHGMIRGCSNKGDVNVECEVFDASGKSLSKSAVDMGNQDFYKVALSNLPNGEFVLLTETSDGQNGNITKFDANNKRIGSVEFPEFTCDDDTMISIKDIFKEDNKNCMSTICYDNEHVDVSKHCFDDVEFK